MDSQPGQDEVVELIARCAEALSDLERLRDELHALRLSSDPRAQFAMTLFELELAQRSPEGAAQLPVLIESLLVFWHEGTGLELAQVHPAVEDLWANAASTLVTVQVKRFNEALKICWDARGDADVLKEAVEKLEPEGNRRVEFARCLYHLELARMHEDASRVEFARRAWVLLEACQSKEAADELVGTDIGLRRLWAELRPDLDEFFEGLEEDARRRKRRSGMFTPVTQQAPAVQRNEVKTDPVAAATAPPAPLTHAGWTVGSQANLPAVASSPVPPAAVSPSRSGLPVVPPSSASQSGLPVVPPSSVSQPGLPAVGAVATSTSRSGLPVVTSSPSRAAMPASIEGPTPGRANVPVLTEVPVPASSPSRANIPVLTEAPVPASPSRANIPVLTEAPVPASSPSRANIPVLTEAPVLASSPSRANIPVLTEAPVPASSPSRANIPVLTEAPTSSPSRANIAPVSSPSRPNIPAVPSPSRSNIPVVRPSPGRPIIPVLTEAPVVGPGPRASRPEAPLLAPAPTYATPVVLPNAVLPSDMHVTLREMPAPPLPEDLRATQEIPVVVAPEEPRRSSKTEPNIVPVPLAEARHIPSFRTLIGMKKEAPAQVSAQVDTLPIPPPRSAQAAQAQVDTLPVFPQADDVAAALAPMPPAPPGNLTPPGSWQRPALEDEVVEVEPEEVEASAPPPPPGDLTPPGQWLPPQTGSGEVEIVDAVEDTSPLPSAAETVRAHQPSEVEEDDYVPDATTMAFWQHTLDTLSLVPESGDGRPAARLLACETRADRTKLNGYLESIEGALHVPEARAMSCLIRLMLAAQLKEKSLFGQANARRAEAFAQAFSLLAADPASAGRAAVWFQLDGPVTEEALQKGLEVLVRFVGFCARSQLNPLEAATHQAFLAEGDLS